MSICLQMEAALTTYIHKAALTHTCSAIEVEEATAGKVHKLFTSAMVVQRDFLGLHTHSCFQHNQTNSGLITRAPSFEMQARLT